MAAAAIALFLSAAPTSWVPEAGAQNLNQRQTASPAANAKVGRALTKARSKAAQAGDANLNRETVNTNCGPVEIGNTDKADKRRTKADEQVVVVPGDVINICR